MHTHTHYYYMQTDTYYHHDIMCAVLDRIVTTIMEVNLFQKTLNPGVITVNSAHYLILYMNRYVMYYEMYYRRGVRSIVA